MAPTEFFGDEKSCALLEDDRISKRTVSLALQFF
jgi:hypothetical protein